MKPKRSLLLMLVLLLAASVANAEERLTVIRIGHVSSGLGKGYAAGSGGVLVAKGWMEAEFKSDGIKVEHNYFVGAGPAINEALANNTLDFAFYGDLPALIGKAAGLKTVVLAGSRGSQTYVAVPSKSTVKTIQDLRGKHVGVPKGTYMHLSFDRKLESLGLSEKDFAMVNINNVNGETALAANSIDAFVGTSNLLRLRDLGLARIIYSNKGDPEDWKGQGVLVVQEAFLKRYPEVTKRFLKVWLRTMRWETDEANRKEVFQINEKAGLPVASMIEDRAGLPQKDVYNPLFDANFINHFKLAVTFSKQNNLIRQEFDIEKWLDRDLLTQSLKDVGWRP